ncbi:hypothetical protein D3C87_1258400 [compost metagenome]
MAEIGVGRAWELPQHGAGGGALADGFRIGDVEREHATAAQAEAADQHGAPGAVDLRILDGRCAVDRVGVDVVEVRQGGQLAVHQRRHVGEQLLAAVFILGGERVHHAVVRAHVEHRLAGPLAQHELGVVVTGVAGVGRAHVLRAGVDDVAQDGGGAGAELAGGVALVALVPAQPVDALRAVRAARRHDGLEVGGQAVVAERNASAIGIYAVVREDRAVGGGDAAERLAGVPDGGEDGLALGIQCKVE